MQRILPLAALLFVTLNMIAQAPQKMTYQAVIRNASNSLVVSSPVKMKISILQGSTTGTSVYSEEHNPTTNANGLVTIEIGNGTSQQGTFSNINWGNGTYYLKTETDPANGTNYSIEGTSQLLSVPYALESNNSGNGIKSVSSTGDTMYLNNGKFIIVPGISIANNTSTPNTLTDTSGNVYPTIKIGTQIWMAENLRTTKYRDGSDIPVVIDSTQWANNFNNDNPLQQPMMCWYDNDQATYTANKFGALYNWYAINPATNGNKNVCPTSWHVPSDAEWNVLISYLDPSYNSTIEGGVQSATVGGKMKSTDTLFWQSPNSGATNSSKFSAFPAGSRDKNASFLDIGERAHWWSSTDYNSGNAWFRYLSYEFEGIYRYVGIKQNGFSVRCIKD